METPSSSTRRITRSQALAMDANNNSTNNIPLSSRKNEESEMGVLKSRQRTNGVKQQEQRERSVLIDITNDSPIVGLAMKNLKTPSSVKMMISQNKQTINTPGSGEALLRNQVKTLLQKVEEEAVISKISFEHRHLIHKNGGFLNSPMAVLAPTPANTPQVSDCSGGNYNGFESFMVSPVAENFNFSQMLNEIIDETNHHQEDNGETEEKNQITRSLFTDFSDKFLEGSDSSGCNSVVTYQGCKNKSNSVEDDDDDDDDDDDASVWSVQVNASSNGDEFEEKEEVDDELCEGISKISVNGGDKFTGNDEIEEKEEEEVEFLCSSGILKLKGLPSPKGKHLRFADKSC